LLTYSLVARGSAAVTDALQEEGEPLRAHDARQDQHGYGRDGEDEQDTAEGLMSDSAGWKPESSKAAPMWSISLNVLSGDRNDACLRVPSTRCWTIMRFTGVSARASNTVWSCIQLRPGTCPSVSVIGPPFRPGRGRDGGAGRDWDRFGYRVIRDRLVGEEEQRRVHAPRGVQLASGVFAVTIHGRGSDAEASGDLFGIHVGVDEAKALALAVGQSICAARHQQPPGLPLNLITSEDSPKRGLRRAHAIGACRAERREKAEIAMEA